MTDLNREACEIVHPGVPARVEIQIEQIAAQNLALTGGRNAD